MKEAVSILATVLSSSINTDDKIEAINSLADYLPDHDAVHALGVAAETATDGRVRQAAIKALGGRTT